uniref:RRM domain-containing protein n=2 Tax=Clastoptera arizonana TaxID=38151 RepID=A0A1B6CKG4_9HEMI
MENEKMDSSDSEQEYIPPPDLLNKLALVEENLKQNPSYELYLEKVALLKEIKDPSRILLAFEEFGKVFPLTSDLWLDYIHIAIENDYSEDAVLNLFATAVKDYLAVPIWVEYINYTAVCLNDDERNINWARNIHETGLSLPALHTKSGVQIWKSAIEFEKRLYSYSKDDEENTEQNVSQTKNQIDRIVSLYHRMFSLPLMGISDEFEEFKSWLTEENITADNLNSIIENFNNTNIKLSSIIPHEKKLERCSETDIYKYKVYPKYLNFVEDYMEFSIAQLQCLYERMIEQFPIEPAVWIQYLGFLKSGDKTKVLSVAERSVRNCPYNGKLRVELAKIAQNSGYDEQIVKEILKSAIEVPYEDPQQLLMVWKCFIDFLGSIHLNGNDRTSEIEELFASTSKVIDEYFYFHKSNTRTQFLTHWAEIKANVLKDVESARNIWISEVLVKNNKSDVKLWSKYLDLEKSFGTPESLREGYLKAMSSVRRGLKKISEKWLEFEKQNGNSEQLNEAIKTCEIRLQNLGVEEMEHSERDEKKDKTQFQKKPMNKFQQISTRDKVEKKEVVTQGKWQNFSTDTSKLSNNNEAYMPPAGEEHRMIFLSNLNYTVTVDDIKTVFEDKVGPTESIKLKTDFRGRSKGFGYIVYKSPESIELALKMDHTVIHGRPAFVSKYNPDKNTRKHYFSYSTNLEKNKLFVRGLSFNTTRETLMTFFSKYGTVKDVRLVTLRTGKSKGLAYIDFETEEMASKALEATNGVELDGHKIFVAISQPSVGEKRHVDETTGENLTKKPCTSFIPTSVKIPQKKTKIEFNTQTTPKPESNGSESSGKQPQLSNDDFRKLLLQKK